MPAPSIEPINTNQNTNITSFDREIAILRQRFMVDYTSHSEKRLREEYTFKCITDLDEGIDNIFIRSPKHYLISKFMITMVLN